MQRHGKRSSSREGLSFADFALALTDLSAKGNPTSFAKKKPQKIARRVDLPRLREQFDKIDVESTQEIEVYDLGRCFRGLGIQNYESRVG